MLVPIILYKDPHVYQDYVLYLGSFNCPNSLYTLYRVEYYSETKIKLIISRTKEEFDLIKDETQIYNRLSDIEIPRIFSYCLLRVARLGVLINFIEPEVNYIFEKLMSPGNPNPGKLMVISDSEIDEIEDLRDSFNSYTCESVVVREPEYYFL